MITEYFNNKEPTNKAFNKGGFFPADMGKSTDESAVFPMVIKNQVDVPFAVVVVNEILMKRAYYRIVKKTWLERLKKNIFYKKIT